MFFGFLATASASASTRPYSLVAALDLREAVGCSLSAAAAMQQRGRSAVMRRNYGAIYVHYCHRQQQAPAGF